MGRLAVAVIVSLWVVPVSILVNHIVPEPYMDEIFHVPQAQQYCRGNFRSWDPMITTPPGLYYLSLAHVAYLFPGMAFVKAVSSFSEGCSTVILRSTNGVLAVICGVLVYEIIRHLRPNLDERKATLFAVVLAMYPLHWFFTVLYYTDVASLAAVLAMYIACVKKKYWLSALLGALAVVIRQTNVVWILFVCCSEVINIALVDQKDKIDVDDTDFSIRNNSWPTPKNSVAILRKRKVNNSADTEIRSMPASSIFPQNYTSAFVAFVRWNWSVVLGAQAAHPVSPHFAQIMYFGVFSVLAMTPTYCSFSQAAELFWSIWKKKSLGFFQVSVALVAGFIAIHFFSIAHSYLLADNRHYPFYLWRKVIKAHWSMKHGEATTLLDILDDIKF